jgi:hypothetical protein
MYRLSVGDDVAEAYALWVFQVQLPLGLSPTVQVWLVLIDWPPMTQA